MILVKEREYLGTTTWLSPRNGRQTRAHFSPWKTIATVDTIQEAQTLVLKQFRGLGQRAAFEKGKMVVTQDGRWNKPGITT